MHSPRYALVTYVRNPVGEFIAQLRQELHPDLPHLAAHVTILPPRQLRGSEFSALELLEDVCAQISPFEITLSDVETFVPATPTVFIRVAQGNDHLHDLHERLGTKVLASAEEWPYMPHLTIVKMSTQAQAEDAYIVARDRWAQFRGSRQVQIQQLTFVREAEENRWVDLAGVPLGRTLVNR
jgi:2'-5' RNA ligase